MNDSSIATGGARAITAVEDSSLRTRMHLRGLLEGYTDVLTHKIDDMQRYLDRGPGECALSDELAAPFRVISSEMRRFFGDLRQQASDVPHRQQPQLRRLHENIEDRQAQLLAEQQRSDGLQRECMDTVRALLQTRLSAAQRTSDGLWQAAESTGICTCHSCCEFARRKLDGMLAAAYKGFRARTAAAHDPQHLQLLHERVQLRIEIEELRQRRDSAVALRRLQHSPAGGSPPTRAPQTLAEAIVHFAEASASNVSDMTGAELEFQVRRWTRDATEILARLAMLNELTRYL